MMRLKRMFVLLTLVISLLGMVVCGAAIVFIWYANAKLVRLGGHAVELASPAITAGQQVTDYVTALLAPVDQQLARLEQQAIRIGGAVRDEAESAAVLKAVSEAALAGTVQSAGEALYRVQRLRQSLAPATQAVAAVLPPNALPDSAELFQTAQALVERLQAAVADLEAMVADMRQGRRPFDGKAIADRIVNVRQSLQQVDIPMAAIRTRLERAGASLLALKSRLSGYVLLGSVAFSLVLGWLFCVQTFVFIKCFSVLRAGASGPRAMPRL